MTTNRRIPIIAPDAAEPATSMRYVRTADRFLDKDCQTLTIEQWALKRNDPTFCSIGYWQGEGGAWVYTFWLGLDMSFGVGAVPAIFNTQVAAFGNQPHVEWECPSDTEERAVAVHHRVVYYVERGITPPFWDLDDI